MSYPTDPAILFEFTNAEWESLLASTWCASVPRAIVRVPEERPVGLREEAEQWLAMGLKERAAATQLNIPVAKLRLILTGKRR